MDHGQSDQNDATDLPPDRARPAPPGVIESAVAALSLDQKIGLLTGVDNFTLAAQPLIGLRAMVFSDGPAGVRGPVLDPHDRSSSPPCPVALAATWDPELVAEVAAEIGREARTKGIDVVLGPTLNLARSPYGGRGFECFGEDPVLSARTAVAYVRGLQSSGVAATAKHFVGNDCEFERWTADTRVDEATLREVYLLPFEACVAEADCAMVMAGYNLVNGTSMTEHGYLINTVLKGEWAFAGAVVSDWFAARSTVETASSGLDLVMPGPEGPWGRKLAEAVVRGTVCEAEIDDKLSRLLRVAVKVGALGGPLPTRSPGPSADRAILRRAAARSFVLLRNSGSLLPLGSVAEAPAGARFTPPRSIAVIGPNASDPQYQGRGSAEVGMALSTSPLEGMLGALHAIHQVLDTDTEAEALVLRSAQGCRTWTSTPLPARKQLRDPETGVPGAVLEVFGTDEELRYRGRREDSEVTWWDPDPLVTGPGIGRIVLRAAYTATNSGRHRIAVGGIGTFGLEARIRRVTGETEEFRFVASMPHPADSMVAHAGPAEVGRDLDMTEGDVLEFTGFNVPDGYRHELVRFRIGIVPMPSEEELLTEAVEAARECDVAIVVVGSTTTTESEGYDRESLALPGRQDELVASVAAANPRTVVVVNSGMPMLMPWADQVGAIIQAWFPGQEFGDALADVLLGVVEPVGRLPVTMPRSEAALPIGKAVPVDGSLEYTEGPLIGYRGYDRAKLEPRFPFGHGLGYTSWCFERLELPTGVTRAGTDVDVIATVRNVGRRSGELVVQAYLSAPGHQDEAEAHRPVRVLSGFARVQADPGATGVANIRLPHRTFARWDQAGGGWAYPHGTYLLEIGFSERDLHLRAEIEVG